VTIEQVAQSALGACHRFFQWWVDELFGCLPKALDFRKRWARGEWVVLATPTELLLGRDRGAAGLETVERFAVRDGKVAPPPAQVARVAKLDTRASLTLRLPAAQALRRTIRLPIAALENLRDAIAFQLDRYTPFSHEHAYFDYLIVQRDEAAGQLVIEATVIAREIVSTTRGLVERLGLRVAAVEIMRDDEPKPPTRLTMPELTRRPRAQHALNLAAAALLVLLTAAALILPLAREQKQANALAQQLDTLRRQSATAARLQGENDALRREATFLADRASHPTGLSIVLELTKLIPDDSWLEVIQYSGTQVDIAGISGSASALIGRLAQSTVFHNMEFRSPVTPDQRSGRERFQVSGQVSAPATQAPAAPKPADAL
jgi:general secretion pathway protein L